MCAGVDQARAQPIYVWLCAVHEKLAWEVGECREAEPLVNTVYFSSLFLWACDVRTSAATATPTPSM